ncbi:MAG: hypothetical protein DGJ47_000730 [Rickettsiaceae bacterium]
MAILANRGKIKSSLAEYGAFFTYALRRIFAIFLLILSLYFLQFSYPKPLKNVINEFGGNVLLAVEYSTSTIVDSTYFLYNKLMYFKHIEDENSNLKAENAKLQKVINSALFLKSENKSLRDVLKISTRSKQKVIPAKVIGTAITPYSQRATVNVGLKNGVEVDYIVRGSKGLLGRVVEVSENYSTIILVGDSEFRIPVLAANENSYGILVKENSVLKIIYIEDEHNFKVGATIYTSGDGTIFPSGIAVAVVSKVTDDAVYVQLIDKINGMGFVTIEPSFAKTISN